ncbi:hypothetical protein F5X96DRAFT_258963 [Biscogniauxia mediterranea]|nr:hypothetical protein F5X96DRAFT_258963 [Biscogniauxia mediterranea]
MNLPSGSQCCRLARYRLRPQYDSIWVPESLLATTLDRYCVTVRTIVRYGSSVPGPMENRRRLGKRQMGELNFGHAHSPPPLWEFESLADLTQWKWRPPSSPDEVLRQRPTPMNELASAGFLADLRQAIFPSPNTDASSNEMHNPHDEILPPDTVLSGVAEGEAALPPEVEPVVPDVEYQELPIPVWDAQSTPSEIIAAGLDLLCHDLSRASTKVEASVRVDSMPNLANFCASWRSGLAEGLFSGESICRVLDGIIEGLDTKATATNTASVENIKIHLYSATIEGVSSREQQNPERFEHLVWGDILQGISKIKLNNLRLFQKAMDCIPDSRLDSMSPGIIANLDAYVKGLGRAKKAPTIARQACKILPPLERLGENCRKNVMNTVAYRLLLYSGSADIDFALSRLGLLHVLARLPGTDKELAEACRLLESDTDSRPLSDKEICHLFVARLRRRAMAKDVSSIYYSIRRIKKYSFYRHLARSLWLTHQYYHAKAMAAFMHYLGRDDRVVHLVKGVRNYSTSDITSLANMAVGMGKPSVAVEILCLFDRTGRRAERFWRSSSASKALGELVDTHGLNFKKFLATLNVRPIPPEKPRNPIFRTWDLFFTPGIGATWAPRPRMTTVNLKQILKTTRAAMALARTPFLTKRKAFALMGECVRYLKAWDASIPSNIIKAIIHNVTRDLAEGRPGKSLRMRWLLHLLREEFGDRVMLRTGMSLKRWRDINIRRWRLRGR